MVVFIEGARRRSGLFSIFLLTALLLSLSAFAADSGAKGPGSRLLAGGGIGTVVPPPPEAVPAGRSIYPIRGAHEYWEGFGGARGHEGVDVGARCGTPLVAVQAGKVRFAKYHARAGNYVVIDLAASTLDVAYMHLSAPAAVIPGQTVVAGQPLGLVGDTGNASGCHLHFEVWEGAYYGGGAPIDPVPFLLSLEPERKKRLARQASRR